MPLIDGAGLKVNGTVPSLVTVTDRGFDVPPVTVPNASDPVILTSVPFPLSGSTNEEL